MAQLIQVIKKFDDGTETIHEFVPNANAAEIEARVADAMIPAEEETEEEVIELAAKEEVLKKKKAKKEVAE